MQNRFTAYTKSGDAVLCMDGKAIYEGVRMEVGITRGVVERLCDPEIICDRGTTRLVFPARGHVAKAELRLSESGSTGLVSVFVRLCEHTPNVNPFFNEYGGVRITFSPVGADAAVGCSSENRIWWMHPAFSKGGTLPLGEVQDLHTVDGDTHAFLLPLSVGQIRSEISGGAVVLSSGLCGENQLSGNCFAFTRADNPYRAVETLFSDARRAGWLPVPLKSERKYPVPLEGFGWCTWNAFYQNVTEAGIFEKMEEFQALGVKLDWLLIDDGWLQTRDNRLWAFEEDRTKFPSGLAGTVKRLKEQYGVKYVGVWHAVTGYWCGIHKDGPLWKDFGDCTFTRAGDAHLLPHAGKAYRFYDAWHTYLSAQGIDFIKVDNQASYGHLTEELYHTSEALAVLHAALDRSAEEHFGGALINCMGANLSDDMARPLSPLNRSSDDFFPEHPKAPALINHTMQNLWVSAVAGQIHYSDFDMFWSRHPVAVAHAILRAVSGGPLYTSDPLTATDKTTLDPLFDKDGNVVGRFPRAAVPTLDCFYHDPWKTGFVKFFNRAPDGSFTLAAFGTTEEGTDIALRISDLPDVGEYDRYVAQNFFTGECEEVSLWHSIKTHVSLDKPGLWNLYLVKDGKVSLGDNTVYCGSLTQKGEAVPYRDVLKK